MLRENSDFLPPRRLVFQGVAASLLSRQYSKAFPRNWFVPDLSTMLTTAPATLPSSAE